MLFDMNKKNIDIVFFIDATGSMETGKDTKEYDLIEKEEGEPSQMVSSIDKSNE